MIVGHAVAGYLLRQMEFDADRYEARLGGTAMSEQKTAQAGRPVGRLSRGVERSGRVPSRGTARRQPAALGRRQCRGIAGRSAACDRQDGRRVDHAGCLTPIPPTERPHHRGPPRERARRVSERAARIGLVQQFRRRVPKGHLGFLSRHFRPELQDRRHAPDRKPAGASGPRHRGPKGTLGRFFQGAFSGLRILSLPAEIPEPEDINPKATAAELRNARDEMLEEAEFYKVTLNTYRDHDKQLREVAEAQSLLDAKFRLKSDMFSVPLTNVPETSRRSPRRHAPADRTWASSWKRSNRQPAGESPRLWRCSACRKWPNGSKTPPNAVPRPSGCCPSCRFCGVRSIISSSFAIPMPRWEC